MSAFDRLRKLIAGIPPPQGKIPSMLHLGESRLLDDPSTSIKEYLQNGWNHYPAPGGDTNLREAYFFYLENAYGLSSEIAALRNIAIECAPGSKQALSIMIMSAIEHKRREINIPPVIALPDPCYPAYVDAALFLDCEIAYYSAQPEKIACGILALTERCQNRLAAVVICNPGNPYGKGLPGPEILQLAEKMISLIIFDECYIDLYYQNEIISPLKNIASGLMDGNNIIVSHTLSKRNGMPGLRSSFLCGGESWINRWASFNRACGVSLADPVRRASAVLWKDGGMVQRHRDQLVKNTRLFNTFFPNIPLPDAGFFVCMNVTDDVLCTRLLWREAGILVMPSTYLTHDPAHYIPFIRIALIYPEHEMNGILLKMKFFFSRHPFLL